MSCYRPIPAYKLEIGGVSFKKNCDGRRIDLPCGKCVGCLERRAQDWALRVMHEAQLWESNCFVTATYARDALPPGGFLEYRDFQLFLKRLRRFFGFRIRFFMCGEYGPLNLRPHYHACFFNLDFPDKVVAGKSGAGAVFFNSPVLDRLWSHGRCTVQPLVHATAMYCARYVMKKQEVADDGKADPVYIDGDGVVHSRPAEFSRCSLKPGIGAEWFRRFGGDIYPHDFAVADGRKFSAPKYYDKLERRKALVSWDEVEFKRAEKARLRVGDQTDARLAVRELVHKARIVNQKRGLE